MKNPYTASYLTSKTVSLLPREGERGSVLVIALFMIFAAAALGSVLAMVSSVDLQISGNQRVSTEALYAAEAGLNEATHRLSLMNPTIATVGGWTGNIALSDAEPYDPNWKVRIYMTDPGSAPAANGSDVHTGTLQNLSGSYLKFSEANGTSDDVLTIEHKWDDLNGNGVREAGEIIFYDSRQIPRENFVSGHPIDIITVTGEAGGGTRVVQSEVTKVGVSANALGALYIDKAINVSGTPSFCGYNHSIAVPDETEPNACFAFHEASGHKPGVTTTGDEVQTQGNAYDMLGQPAPTDTSSINPWYEIHEVLGMTASELQKILKNADFNAIPNTGNMDGITYINGNASINSNLVGSGLCYVTGDVVVNGDFIYRGLVYIEGDVKVTGNPFVLGAVTVKGTSDFNVSAGNATILFSSEAVKTYIGQFLPMVQLSWREL
jgi:hypothetical protein